MTAVLAEVFPAGEFLAEELDARGWTQADFAAILGRPAQFVSEIISGKKEITRESAAQIGAALGTSAQMWLTLQDQYMLRLQDHNATAQNELDDVRRRARLNEKVPVTVLRKVGVLRGTSLDELEREVLTFLELESFEGEPQLAFAAKRSNHGAELSPLQTAWLYMVRRAARQAPLTAPYSPEALDKVASTLPHLIKTPEDFAEVPLMLAQAGVRLVYVPALPGCKIDGCAMVVDQMRVIGLSGRGKRLDKVLFALMHEIAHLRHGHVDSDCPIVERFDSATAPEDDSEEANHERQANDTAAQWIFPQGLPDLPARLSGPAVASAAAELNIAPIVLVGHLQHEGNLDWRTALAKGAPNVDGVMATW